MNNRMIEFIRIIGDDVRGGGVFGGEAGSMW
jgi:hypothetical protein